MNNIRLFSVILLTSVGCLMNANAQENFPDLPLALSYSEEELPEYLISGDRSRIANKLARLCNQSHFIASGEHQTFSIFPRIDIIEETHIEGLKNITVLDLELSISIRQTEGGIMFGTYSWEIKGSGSSTVEAMRSAFQNLPQNDENYIHFLQNLRSRINTYYLANCSSIIQRADQFIIIQEYKAAILELIKVPTEANNCSEQVEEKLQFAYDAYQREYCGPMLQQAKALKAKGQISQALDVLLQISPNSSCGPDANTQIQQIDQQVSRANQAKLDFARQMYIYDRESQMAQQQLRIQRWITVAELAKATAVVVGGFSPSLNIPVYLNKQ